MHMHGNNKWGKIMWILCIAAPISAMIVLMLSNNGIIKVGGYVPFLLFLLCPLSHLLMIPFMAKLMDNKEKIEDTENIDKKPSCH